MSSAQSVTGWPDAAAGAITGTLGVAALVYGLSNASTDSHGLSHGGDTKVVASLAAAVALLAAFVVTERRSRHALLPLRLLANRSRSGAYLIMLCLAMLGPDGGIRVGVGAGGGAPRPRGRSCCRGSFPCPTGFRTSSRPTPAVTGRLEITARMDKLTCIALKGMGADLSNVTVE